MHNTNLLIVNAFILHFISLHQTCNGFTFNVKLLAKSDMSWLDDLLPQFAGEMVTYETMIEYCQNLTTEFPFLFPEMSPLSQKTYGSRQLVRLEMSFNTNTGSQNKLEYYKSQLGSPFQFQSIDVDKSYVLLVSAQNANSLSSVNMMLSQMSYYVYQFFQGDQSVVNLLRLNVLVIYPLINPDGYEYVRQTYMLQNYTSSYDLAGFTKNRNALGSLCSTQQLGLNLRNNYDYKFAFDDQGSDSEQCMERYRGTSAFSEVESSAVKQEIESIAVRDNSSGINYNAVIFLESHENKNALVIPYNYLKSSNTILLAQQDIRVYKLFSDLGNWVDPTTNTNLTVGASIDVFDQASNGDPVDWVFQIKSILSMTLFMAASQYQHSDNGGNLFLGYQEMLSLLTRNQDLITQLIQRSSRNPQIHVYLPDICEQTLDGTFNSNLCDKASDYYDLYPYQYIDINNNGRVDAAGSVQFSFQTRMEIHAIFMRSSLAQPYYSVAFSKNSSNITTLSLPNIEGDLLRDLGIVIIFHYEVENITSIQDVKELVLYNEYVLFTLTYENSQAILTSAASVNLQLLYTYLNIGKIEASINQGKFRFYNVLGYTFYILFGALNLVWFLQVKFNVCKKPRRREDKTLSALQVAEIELQVLNSNEFPYKEGNNYGEEKFSNFDPRSKNYPMHSTVMRTSEAEDPPQNQSGHQILVSEVSIMSKFGSNNTSQNTLGSQYNSSNKKSSVMQMDMPINFADSQSSGTYLDSTRSLMLSSRALVGNGQPNHEEAEESNFNSANLNDYNTKQQLTRQKVKDPYRMITPENQQQFINFYKKNQNRVQDLSEQRIDGKIEKIGKDQFEVVRQGKGKLKVIRERDSSGNDFMRASKRQILEPIQTQIQEEELETSIFQVDNSNITNIQVQTQVDESSDHEDLREQMQAISKHNSDLELRNNKMAPAQEAEGNEARPGINFYSSVHENMQNEDLLDINLTEGMQNLSVSYIDPVLLEQQEGANQGYLSSKHNWTASQQKQQKQSQTSTGKSQIPPLHVSSLNKATPTKIQRQQDSPLKLSDLSQPSNPAKDLAQRNDQFFNDLEE